MTIDERFFYEFAGPPLRVALNVLLTAGAGVLFDCGVLGAPLSEKVLFGALMAPLIAILIAGGLKPAKKKR